MSDDLHLHPIHARLIEVETALAFQQQLVDDLNASLLSQSRRLLQLENQVRTLQEQLSAGKAGGQPDSGENVSAADEDQSE